MATWKGSQPAVDAGNGLPAEIAGGPSVAIWCPDRVSVASWLEAPEDTHAVQVSAARAAWLRAGDAYGAERGLRRAEWWALLPQPVRYFATTSLGRCHAASGEPIPWDE